jgi:hypothetical protein
MKSRLEKLDPTGNFSLCLVSFVGTVGLSALMILPILVGSYVDYLGFGEDTAGWISADTQPIHLIHYLSCVRDVASLTKAGYGLPR